jgi:serine/threonine-protein kinase
VILKSLLPDLALQEGFIDQFLDEARVAATLNHPNVVSIYEVGLWNGTYYIAMEYIRGRNLSQLLRRAIEQQVAVPAHVAGRIIHDAAVGLDHAHTATDGNGLKLNIVHRDISPQNIMVREDGVTKVVDFGIAHASNRAASRTATGALKGKLAYMAPEQIIGQTSALVDQFALGIVFWELLSSRRLFKADSDIVIARKVMEEPIPLPSSIVRDIPPAVDAVVMRMLERNTSKRFASCAEAASAIEQALVGLTPSGGSPVTAFMRRLGTEDLSVKVKTSSGSPATNFVISLKQNVAGAEAVEIDMSTRTPIGANVGTAVLPHGISAATPVPPPLPVAKRRGGVIAVMALSALGVVAIVGVGVFRGAPTDAAGPVAVVVPPAPVAAEPPSIDTAPAIEPPKPARVTFDTQPPGATVRLDGKPLGVAPQVAEVSGETVHYLQVDKPGFRTAEQQLEVASGEEKHVIISLLPQPVAQHGPPLSVPVTTAEAPGFLTLDTKPWTKVNIDGDPFGVVPLSKKRLSSGKHTLEMINEGENIRVTRVVEIAPNQVTKLQLTLP